MSRIKLPLVIVFNITLATIAFYSGIQYESNKCNDRLYEADVYYGNELYSLNLMLIECKETKDGQGREHQEQSREVQEDQGEE